MMIFERILLIFAAAALAGLGPARLGADIDSLPERHPRDESEYRRFVLDNGIRVILLSDPKLNRSSASMSVGVGSLVDPPRRQGLAHFLEHMLFLGTEKYPDVNEYGNYLRANGGYSNAYTSGDHTNYHFEIRHEAFEGALDRFAQFFIAPLFSEEFIERELNAVNSEHEKNLENDRWRLFQVRNSLYREGHPNNHFSTGNRETLAGIVREEFVDFYLEHYSADRMTLAVTGRASLDRLEEWVRRLFSRIENRELGPISYPTDFLPPEAALRIAHVEPITEVRQLQLEFPLPATIEHYESKPAELIGYILGYEGRGSLLSRLKEEGLAIGLGAGAWNRTADYGSFFITIDLTPEGLEDHSRVLELIFSKIGLMRSSGYPSRLFQERRTMARLDEIYADRGEGSRRAVFLANQIRQYPLEIAEREPFLWIREDPDAYFAILDRLRPDNFLALLVAPGLETDAIEPIYGTRYRYMAIAGESFERLENPPPVAGLHLPAPNPFIPERVVLLPEQPVRLIDEPGLSLYYSQDLEFERPQVAHIFRVRLPMDAIRLRTAVLLRFYADCVREVLNEITYTASAAGLNFSFEAGLEGVRFAIDGYNESAARLLEEVMGSLKTIDLPEDRFEAVKDRFVRDIRNFPRGDAWRISLETRRAVVREHYYPLPEQLAMAEGITLADVREFAGSLYRAGKIEALAHGNLAADEAIAAARIVEAALDPAALPEEMLYQRRLLAQNPGGSVVTAETLVVNNSAFRREYLLGGDTPEIRAATQVLSNFISEPTYSELRTRQQLGYIVFGGAGNEEHTHFAYFIIQSSDYPADVLGERTDAFVATLPDMLAELPEEAWTMIKEGVRDRLLEKDKSIAERAARLFELAYDRNGDWGRHEDTLRALDNLSRERAAEILAAALAPETRRMRSFHAFARDHRPEREIAPSFGDRDSWKASQVYR